MKGLANKRNVKILISGLAIIVLTNVVALAGVAYNRSGEPDAVVELTERELGLPYNYGFEKENTGLGLRINCRVEDLTNDYLYNTYNCFGQPAWLNKEKLLELGFDLNDHSDHDPARWAYNKILPRQAFIVLEYNGAAHQRAVSNKQQTLVEAQTLLTNNPDNQEFEKRVKDATDKLHAEQDYNSRLFVIDAGLDKATLRSKYADTERYILMQALIRPTWTTVDKQNEWAGHITDLLIDNINIPLQHRDVFRPVENNAPYRSQNQRQPRYKVRVAFGKRAEPWVIGVEEM